jgi:hypothetical protein
VVHSDGIKQFTQLEGDIILSLSPAQLQTLKAAIAAETDPAFVGYRTNGQTTLMASFYNTAHPSFVVFKSSETVANVGLAVNYVAFEALTTANLEKINTFTRLNMVAFDPSKSDIRSFWANVFSGALGGFGQATRDAFDALWRRFATRGERLYATGTGTTVAPGVLVFQGAITDTDISQAINLP